MTTISEKRDYLSNDSLTRHLSNGTKEKMVELINDENRYIIKNTPGDGCRVDLMRLSDSLVSELYEMAFADLNRKSF